MRQCAEPVLPPTNSLRNVITFKMPLTFQSRCGLRRGHGYPNKDIGSSFESTIGSRQSRDLARRMRNRRTIRADSAGIHGKFDRFSITQKLSDTAVDPPLYGIFRVAIAGVSKGGKKRKQPSARNRFRLQSSRVGPWKALFAWRAGTPMAASLRRGQSKYGRDGLKIKVFFGHRTVMQRLLFWLLQPNLQLRFTIR